MHSILGPAPILDFDGTVATLPVDWAGLRQRLGVERIGDLWARGGDEDWAEVTRAEVIAAADAVSCGPVVAALADVETFALLTNNSEEAVSRFIDGHPTLGGRVALVVGRETLLGPKADAETFRTGYLACVEATREARGSGPVVYVGDAAYELRFATELGALALHVEQVAAP